MVRLVLFDIDGTLIHSGGAGEKAFARFCVAEVGVPDGAARLHFAGRTDPSIVRDFFQQQALEPSAENFRRFFDRYVFYLDELMGQLIGCVLPGVQDLIADLQGLRTPPVIGLLTGNIRLGAQIKLRHYELWDCFQTGAFGDDHEDRNQLAVIARERGQGLVGETLTGEQVLIVGDTPRDIECARTIGAQALAVATGSYSAAELAKHSPRWTVESLKQVRLQELCG